MYTYGHIFRIEMYTFAQHGSIERLVCRTNRNGPSWNPRLRARRATLGNPCPAPRREAPRSAGSLARSLKDVPRLQKPAAAHVRRRANAERHQASFFRAPAGRPQVRRRPAPYSPIGSANRSPTATSRASANLMSVPKVAFTSRLSRPWPTPVGIRPPSRSSKSSKVLALCEETPRFAQPDPFPSAHAERLPIPSCQNSFLSRVDLFNPLEFGIGKRRRDDQPASVPDASAFAAICRPCVKCFLMGFPAR